MPYLYLIKEREFIKTNENIYKIGKTKQKNNKRFYSYPKGSILILQVYSDEIDKIERKLITLFKKQFKHAKSYGKEYFDGDHIKMQDMILDNVIFKKEIIKTSDGTETKKRVEKLTYENNGVEYTNYHDTVNMLEKPLQDFLRGNEKRKLECVDLISNCYKNYFRSQHILKFISHYFKDHHYEKLDYSNIINNRDHNGLSSLKFEFPNLNIIEKIYDKCENLNDFLKYEQLALKDDAYLSPYKNLSRKEKENMLRNKKYKFIDMNVIKGKLSQDKLFYLSQNIKLTDKIYKKYFNDKYIDDEIKKNLENNPSINK